MVPFPALAQLLAEPKISALILDPAPALLFDGTGALRFGNRAAISAYGAASMQELLERSPDLFGEIPETAREFIETLPLNGAYRRESIALKHATETFRCARIGLSDGAQAVVFTGLARERSDGDLGKSIGIVIDGERQPFALFDMEGKPLHANRMATTIMGPAGTLLNMHASAAQSLADARDKGAAEIPFGVLRIVLRKIDVGARSVLLASFSQPERTAPPTPEQAPEPAPASPSSANAVPDTSGIADTPEAKSTLPEVIHLGPPQDTDTGWEVPAAKILPAEIEEAPREIVPDAEEILETQFAEIDGPGAIAENAMPASEFAEPRESEEEQEEQQENSETLSSESDDEPEAPENETGSAHELIARVAQDAPAARNFNVNTSAAPATDAADAVRDSAMDVVASVSKPITPNEHDEDKEEDRTEEADEATPDAAVVDEIEIPESETGAGQELVARIARDAPAAVSAMSPATARKRIPSRFVWQTDANGNFTSISSDLSDAVGADNAGRNGESWSALITRAGINNAEALRAAVGRRDTWSGVSVLWPVAGTDTARPVELAALPVFDRERNFAGYRGFGVFRDAIPLIAKLKPAPDREVRPDAEDRTVSASEAEVEIQPDPSPSAEVEIPEKAASQADVLPAVNVEIQAGDADAAQEVSHEVSPAEDEFPQHHDPVAETPAGNEAAAVSGPPALEVRPDRVIRVAAAEPQDDTKVDGTAEPDASSLSLKEQMAFHEIGRVLSRETQENDRDRVLRDLSNALGIAPAKTEDEPNVDGPVADATPRTDAPVAPLVSAPDNLPQSERALLDRLPLGVAVHRDEKLLYVNRTLLEWLGMETLDQLDQSGGLQRMFSGSRETDDEIDPTIPRTLALKGPVDEPIPVETRLMTTPWYGQPAMVYLFRRANAGFDERRANIERQLRAAEASTREQQSILDTATDGVLVIDRDGKLTGINKSAEALFGFDFAEIQNASFTMLLAPESHRAAVDYLDGLAANGVASVLNDGREVVGRERQGGLIPLFMTLGKIGDNGDKFCAVLRDITQWKRAEEELTGARRQAEQASLHKSDFLAKISHEMRTPLNAIIGFAEVMMEERFGPVGSERYRQYLKDIHQSGGHLISLINDLLDLSKIEAGKLELNFSSVDLNDIARQCMSIMQPQANRERIIIRTALAENLPPVVADARSIRQIVLNLLSNSVKFTKPGGQVILSTSLTDAGEVVMRVRDTGIGMTEDEVAAALEPFRQLATSGRTGSGGTGLGLPLTKALVEANRASFTIRSAVDSGTLIEVAFPSTRVLAS